MATSNTVEKYRRTMMRVPKLLPSWSPSTVYKHLLWHKSKISNELEVFTEILKNTFIGIYQNSLIQVHTNDTDLNGTPVVKFDTNQHRMMMNTIDRWMKLKLIPPQKLKEVIKYESTSWSQGIDVVDDKNKSMYGNSLFLLKESEKEQ